MNDYSIYEGKIVLALSTMNIQQFNIAYNEFMTKLVENGNRDTAINDIRRNIKDTVKRMYLQQRTEQPFETRLNFIQECINNLGLSADDAEYENILVEFDLTGTTTERREEILLVLRQPRFMEIHKREILLMDLRMANAKLDTDKIQSILNELAEMGG